MTTLIMITPGGETAYVTNYVHVNGTVTPIATATNTVGSPIPVGTYPAAIAISSDGETAYVANEGDNTVTPIALATNTPKSPIQVGGSPIGIAITLRPRVRPRRRSAASRRACWSTSRRPARRR